MATNASPTTSNRSIARSTSQISLATAASRVLGFIRDLLIAGLFGTGVSAQAFVVAFRLPNLFRDLVAEGAMTTAVVPVLSAYRATKSQEEFWRLAQASAVRVLVIATGLGLLGTLGAPWLVRLIAPGFVHDPAKFALTVQMTRWCFPFITLVGVWAFFCGLLNSLNSFTVAALGPAVLNLLMIAGCVWLVPLADPPVLGVIWAVLAGGVAQLVMQLPQVFRLGFRWRWIWRDEGASQMMRLLAPRLVGAAVYQVELLAMTILASIGALAGEGAVAALYFANRLVQLPLALFATASAQASLPVLSERAAMNNLVLFRSTTLKVLRMVMFESLPAAVGLIVMAVPIVQACFERGAFTAEATHITAQTLQFSAIGLLAYAAGRVLAGAFYALHDTRTPVRFAAQALAVNVVLAVVLVHPLHVGGLALATALSSSLNAWWLLRKLEQRIDRPLFAPLLGPFLRMVGASLIMGGGCWVAWRWCDGHVPLVVGLSLIIVGGIILYGLSCLVLRVDEVTIIRRWLSKLRPTQPSSRT